MHSFHEINDALAEELQVRLKNKSPAFFEHVVLELMKALGYGGEWESAFTLTGRSGDGGIDGIVNEDKLGLEKIYLQAKRYEGTVGRPIVQNFAGSLDGVRARKGVLITTSSFSSEAWEFVKNIEKKIVLIDGARLASLMIEHDVGVAQVRSFVVKKIDLDFFEGE